MDSASGSPDDVVAAKRGRPQVLKFGSVELRADRPRPDEQARNVIRSQQALRGLADGLLSPGVTIRSVRNVPLFHADPTRSGIIVREMNGVMERGVFAQGEFKVIE
jgi:hypothetical protein